MDIYNDIGNAISRHNTDKVAELLARLLKKRPQAKLGEDYLCRAMETKRFEKGDPDIALMLLPYSDPNGHVDVRSVSDTFTYTSAGAASFFERALDCCWPTELASLVVAHADYRFSPSDLQAAAFRKRSDLAESIFAKHAGAVDALYVEALKHSYFAAADFCLEHGTAMRTEDGAIFAGHEMQRELLIKWINAFKDKDGYGEAWQNTLAAATTNRCKGNARLLLEYAPPKATAPLRAESLLTLLTEENDCYILLKRMVDGTLRIGDTPEAHLRAMQALALGKRCAPENDALFDDALNALKTVCAADDGATKKLSANLLNRIEHCPQKISWRDIATYDQDFRSRSALIQVLGLAYKIAHTLAPDHPETAQKLLLDMMRHTSGTWESVLASVNKSEGPRQSGKYPVVNAVRIASHMRDCMDDLSFNLLVPDFARKLNPKEDARIDYTKVVEQFRPDMARHVIGDRQFGNIIKVTKDWYKGFASNIAATDTMAWPPLCSEYTAPNGLTLTFLTTPSQLIQEGLDLHHCSGSKIMHCASGKHHMASIRYQGKKLATAQLEWDPGMIKPVMVDNGTAGNLEVTAGTPEYEAVHAFIDAFEKQTIITNKYQVSQYIRNKRADTSLTNLLGFNPRSERPQPAHREEWESRQARTSYENLSNVEDEIFKVIATTKTDDTTLLAPGRRRWIDDARTVPTDRNPYKDHFLRETGLDKIIAARAENPPLKAYRPVGSAGAVAY